MTSGKLDLEQDPIIIQGPEDEYATWEEVEAHYQANSTKEHTKGKKIEVTGDTEKQEKRTSAQGGALSQMLLDKLNFAGQTGNQSPNITPPLSPSTSGAQSSKTSPEGNAVGTDNVDRSPVPPNFKPLFNPVVWHIHEKTSSQDEVFFLTNSADIQHLARDFNVPTKTIHQLRSLIGTEAPQPKNREKCTNADTSNEEPRGLFSYDDESDEEEVVFKPRGRGAARATSSGRGGAHGSMRNKTGHHRSPRLSFSTPPPSTPNKPQIPVEEIDPDSFDRGSFGRGSMPLANTGSTGNHAPNHFQGPSRGNPHRGGLPPTGPARGTYHRGSRGFERGAARGRGRLFVP